MSSSLAHGSDCAQLRTFLDADRSFGEHGNVNLLLDFVAFATIGLVVDRVAFSQLRHTGASFWPPKTVSYKATLLSCPLLSGPSTMRVWIKEGTTNACEKAQAGRDHREAA